MKRMDYLELVADIRKIGYKISTYQDIDLIINKNTKDLVPIFLRHLEKAEAENDKDFLVSRLGIKGYTEATEVLIREFRNKNSSELYRWAIGNSLSLILDKRYEKEYIEIIKNKSFGIARQMVALTLGKLKSDDAIPVFLDLLDDTNVNGHIIMALGYYKNPELIHYIEPFLENEKKWIRKEAEKSIKKLSKYKK